MDFLTPLEPRRLFASVTLIAHGYEPSEKAPGWQSDMATAIARREGGADIYRLSIRGRDEDAFVYSFKLVSADTAQPGGSGDVVVILDWARSSDVFGEVTPADRIAALVRPYFLQPLPSDVQGGGRVLGLLPIHLIGHSRGGAVVTELAKDLGQQGMWVDHVTTLDARPIDDPEPEAWENITFFDNYYQHVSLNGITNGRVIDGARNIDLSPVFDFTLLGEAHQDVWAYYAGTINTNLSSFNGNKIESDWYDSDEDTGPRSQLGYAWSRAVGVTRPQRGNRFRTDGDTAHREDLTIRADGADVWDNISLTSQTAPSAVDQGKTVAVSSRVQDINDDATFTLFLDTDDNPFNGGLIATGITTTGADLDTGSSTGTWAASLATGDLSPGTYYVVAQVTNSEHTRYDYSVSSLTVLPAGTGGSGTLVTFSATKKVTYIDAAGAKVTPKLVGPGSGLIVLPALGQNPSLISLSGTTDRSTFSLAAKNTAAASVTVSGSLAGFSAPKLSVTAGLNATGSIAKLSLATLSGSSTIAGSVTTFSATAVTNATVLIGFSAKTDLTNPTAADITSPSVFLKSFTTKTFSNTTLAAPTITAAKLGALALDPASALIAQTIAALDVTAPTKLKLKPVSASGTPVPGLKIQLVS